MSDAVQMIDHIPSFQTIVEEAQLKRFVGRSAIL